MQLQLPGPVQPEILTPVTPIHVVRLPATDHSMYWPHSTQSPKVESWPSVVALTQSRLPWAPRHGALPLPC